MSVPSANASQPARPASVGVNIMRLLAFVLAIAAPLLLNEPLPPVISHPVQIAAVIGWGLVLLIAPAPGLSRQTLRAVAPPLVVLAILAVACVASFTFGIQHASPGVATAAIMAFAALLAVHGASWGATDPRPVFRAFAIGLLLAGLCGAAMAALQIFGPQVRDDTFVALAPIDGRASGNLNQPNHFAGTLLWALLGLVGIFQRETGSPSPSRWPRILFVAAALWLLFGAALSGSRAALVGTLLLAGWGVLDRRLNRESRLVLGLSPVISSVMIWLVQAWARSHATVVASLLVHPNAPDLTSYRSEIWHQSLVLIANQPWLGVGWGNFNFAWTLTPFASRGAGLVSNAHDVPLQLAVELGVPIALTIVALLLYGLWYAFAQVRRMAGAAGVQVGAGLMMVGLVGLMSAFEFPLWFTYMLFPAAWAFGMALGAAGRQAGSARAGAESLASSPPSPVRVWRVLGLLMTVAGLSAWFDYQNIVSLYVARPNMPSFDDRIRNGQASPLFSYLADYVETTHPLAGQDQAATVARASHVLFNGWLMLSMARQLQAQGQVDKARFLMARLRELDVPAARDFFAACKQPTVTPTPDQCVPPKATYSWRDFE